MRPELYKGTVHRDLFAWAVSESRIPLCYNGDLLTVEDITAVERDFPTVDAVMMGRGPWRTRRCCANSGAARRHPAGSGGVHPEAVPGLPGLLRTAGPAAQRMKEVWFF